MVYLIRRNSEEAREIAKIRMPSPIKKQFLESIGFNRGVYSLTAEVRDWLRDALDVR
ncbi:MAG: hypothetical protein JRG88_09740 [Deltaproteobacteria bacterium]|nr:hypothetical protein [Deltaproteobacteria bacterium]